MDMKHWKRILASVLLAVLLLSLWMKGAAVTSPIIYTLNFAGNPGNRYTMVLPNNLAGGTYNYPNNIIQSAVKRPYKIRGHYSYWFSGNASWNERLDTPYFRIQGITQEVFCVYPNTNDAGEGDFIIPANSSATVTYNAGHYISGILWLGWITNRWGINGGCTITLYFDNAKPDAPSKLSFEGTSLTYINSKCYTQRTVTLSWDTPSDNPEGQVDLSNNCLYEASGIQGYKIYDGVTDITPVYTQTKYITGNSIQLNLNGDGLHTIGIKAFDWEDNPSDLNSIGITVDHTPPTCNLSINNNAPYTKDYNVTLKVSNLNDSGSGVAKVGFSNDNINYDDWETCEPFQKEMTKPWTLLHETDGEKTIYIKLTDYAGNETTIPISKTITLDTTPPTGSITINNGAATTANSYVTLNLNAADPSGVATMQFCNDSNIASYYSTPEPYQATMDWPLSEGEGPKTVYAKFTDRAGNTTEVVIKADITYEIPVYTDNPPVTTLEGSVVWSENQTIDGQVIVPVGASLTISAGVTVTIDGPSTSDPIKNGLIIQGSLTIESGVTFVVPDYRWMGIIISGSGSASLTGATIDWAQRGLAILDNADVTVTGCSFSHNDSGIHVYRSAPVITDCTFEANTYGIKEDAIDEQRPAVNGCVFTSNWVNYYHDPLTRITIEQLNQIPGNGGNQ